MAPALRIRCRSSKGCFVKTSKCSGASSLITSKISSKSSATIIAERFAKDASMISRRGSVGTNFLRRLDTSFACFADVVTRTARASGSCSAWDSMSRTRYSTGISSRSQTTMISLGPANESIPTVPKTCRFASATYAFPGPVILTTC